MRVEHTLTGNYFALTFRMDACENGKRLDSFLKDFYKGRSREEVKRAIQSGRVTITRGGGPHHVAGKLKPSTMVLPLDEVVLRSERKPEPEVSFEYQILHQDADLTIINKPGNLPVHPAGRFYFHTLLVHLRTNGFTKPFDPKEDFFLCHRIDRETSGLLAMANNKESAAVLTEQFAKRTTQKIYLAVVKGHPPDQFSNSLPLKRDPSARVKLQMTTTSPEDPEGLSAHTDFISKERWGGFTLVECKPKTGRQHQIRVHLAQMGFPIVGDKLYGLTPEESFRYFEHRFLSAEAQHRLILPRHALHAHRITFTHPRTLEAVSFEAPVPPDFFELKRKFLKTNTEYSKPPSRPDLLPTFDYSNRPE